MSLRYYIFLSLAAAVFSSCSFDSSTSGGYAVVYGISLYDTDYEEGDEAALNLTYSNDDAESVAAMFEEANYNVVLRRDTQATVENLTSDITYISNRIAAEENFVFYFSGHGVRSYFIPGYETGTEPAGRDVYDEWIFLYGSIDDGKISDMDAALSDDDLFSLIDSLPTEKRVLILDACNSGGFIGSENEVDLVPQNSSEETGESYLDAVKKYFNSASAEVADIPASEAIVITAAGEQEDTYETQSLQHGIFTFYLLESQSEADMNGDGFVTAGECVDYASLMIESQWGSAFFTPRISGGPVDIVLFESSAQ